MDEKMSVNNTDYSVIRLLGRGKGGYSYLVEREGKQFVLKQIHHEPCDYYQFGDKLKSETSDYQKLKALGITMPELYEVDEERERLLKEYIDGPTVFELVKKGAKTDLYIGQMKEMCKTLYSANTNIDYFPTNFVVRDGRIFYIDYECNEYMERWNFENWGIAYWSCTKEFEEYLKNNP